MSRLNSPSSSVIESTVDNGILWCVGVHAKMAVTAYDPKVIYSYSCGNAFVCSLSLKPLVVLAVGCSIHCISGFQISLALCGFCVVLLKLCSSFALKHPPPCCGTNPAWGKQLYW